MPFTAPISQIEEQRFVPFLHRLLDVAFKEITPRFLSEIVIEDKENGTPVTQADTEAERVMRSLIEAEYPTHGIYGEEFGIRETSGESPRYRWILDPIDGTRSFITHSFLFGTLVALERDEGEGFRPILSAIAHAAAGVRAVGTLRGTTLTVRTAEHLMQREAHVRACSELGEATLLASSHWTTDEQVGDERIQTLIDSVKLYRTMGDCFGYFAVATGGADVMIDPDLNYWDLAALLPVVEGAGGVITSFRGGNPLVDLSAVCTAGPLQAKVLEILNA